jgi:hypothetical protein
MKQFLLNPFQLVRYVADRCGTVSAHDAEGSLCLGCCLPASVEKYVRYPSVDGSRFGDPWRSKLEVKWPALIEWVLP